MSETESKLALLSRVLTKVPILLIMIGAIFALLAITTGLRYKEYELSVEGNLWRYVGMVLGLLMIGLGSILYEFERRSEDSAGLPNDFYTKSGRYPLSIDGANEVVVFSAKQILKVTGRSQRREPSGYAVQLMHVLDKQVASAPEPEFKVAAGENYSWEVSTHLPDPKDIQGKVVWRVAFYFIGSHALQLLEHHKRICKIFSPEGKPRWPTIPGPPKEFVRCSEI
jgi:hypothetical protein